MAVFVYRQWIKPKGATQSATFTARRGPIAITPADIDAQMYGDVAIVTAHLVRPSTAPGTSRRTFVLRKTGDRWLIVHLHASNL